MAATDLDPLFVKALRLLHSKSKDSAAQLKAMVDEAIAVRKGLKVPVQSGDAGKNSPARTKGDDDYKRKDAEKRPHDKIIKDSSEPDSKKSKLDSKHRSKDDKDARDKDRDKEKARRDREKKEKEEREAQRQKEKSDKEKKEKAQTSQKHDNDVIMLSGDEESSSQLDAGNFALTMDIACVVCKQFGWSSGNQVVECQECHSLYHQECHKPPVSLSEETVNDPRFVWYCNRCQKMLQKKQQQVAHKPVTKPSKPGGPTLLGKDTSSTTSLANKPFKHDSNIGGLGSSAFRKIDPKVIAPPKETSGQPKPMGLGLAGLAANLTKPQAKSGSLHRKSDGTSKMVKPDGGHKQLNSSSSSGLASKIKTEENRSEKLGVSDKDKKSESYKSSRDDKKSDFGTKVSTSSLSSSASGSEKKVFDSSCKSDKKSTSTGLKLDVLSSSSHAAKSAPVSVSTPDTPDSASGSKSGLGTVSVNTGDKNKKAMAMLSQITANKRMQMMMKKAQAKPSEKKIHIK